MSKQEVKNILISFPTALNEDINDLIYVLRKKTDIKISRSEFFLKAIKCYFAYLLDCDGPKDLEAAILEVRSTKKDIDGKAKKK